MKISDILAKKKTLSFEIFPPKREEDTFTLIDRTIKQLASYKPDYMSVTYGALGNTLSNTAMIARTIKENTDAEPLAHFTCVASTREKVDSVCDELKSYGVENILTLRGDIPKDTTTPIFSDYKHASDLAKYIKSKYDGQFGLAGACYPEKHPDAFNKDEDIRHIKETSSFDIPSEKAFLQMFSMPDKQQSVSFKVAFAFILALLFKASCSSS